MKSVFFLLAICVSNILQSQATSSNLNIKKYIENTPASPNAAALTKYVGASVSLNTGMVSYGIPLYDIKLKDIHIPLNLRYASNGIRVNEAPALTGMGWVLDAGGVITRQRNGGLDEYGQRVGMADNINLCSTEFHDFIHSYSNPTLQSGYDSEPDLFTFNFGGYTGKFILDANKQAFLLPKSNLKIEVDFNNIAYAFKIIAPDGLKYYFGGNNATEETLLNAANRVCQYGNSGNDIPVKTAFYLNKIESPNGDFITFEYGIYCLEQMPVNLIEVCNHTVENYICNQGAPSCPNSRETFYNQAYYRYRILTRINIPGIGRVDFTYNNYNTEGATNSYKEYKTLTNVKVINSQGRQIKSINLNYSYVQTTSGGGSSYPTVIPSKSIRPFLISVSDGPELYNLEYDTPEALPVMGSLSQDLWGFYDGQSNTHFIPNIGTNQVECPEAIANRNVYPGFIKYGMLKKITSPTGGYDQITYEGNVTDNGLVSGVRVQKIVTYDNSTGQPTTKKYYYGSGRGVVPVVTDQKTSGYVCPPNYPSNPYSSLSTCTYQVTSSQPINDLAIFGGNIVSYGTVTESIGGENFENGSIEHTYKTENYNYAYPVMNASLFDAPLNFDAALNGTELMTRIYKRNSAGSLILLKQIENSYSIDPSSINDRIIGWKSYLKWEYLMGVACNYPEVEISKTYYYRFWPHLDRIVTTEYDENGSNPLVKEEKYFYDNNQHLQVTRTETRDSKGNLVQTFTKYPHDYTVPGNVYEKMVSLNMIRFPIEPKTVKNSQSYTIKTNYSFAWFTDKHIVSPVNIEAQKQTNPSESRVRYHAYDIYGNVLELSKENDIHASYIWDYNHSLMVAEAQNAVYNDIAYTSFEADGKGNWAYTGSPVADNTAPTGNKIYNLTGSNNITKAGLNSGSVYKISYWTKNATAFTIGGTQAGYPISGRTVSGWKYFEHKISGQVSVSISGNGTIDELRLYPFNAGMTSYTYETLIGMKSQCNQNNNITYYEYDDYNRLNLVRDQDKNIVKKICYNYYWQQVNCDIYYNQLLSGTFAKSDCPSGYTGSQVVYTVPAGIYGASSLIAANALAQNDINANGQSYANANGTCTPPACNQPQCAANGPRYKCVNGNCEMGIKIYASSVQTGPHLWDCTYHYEWSDGSWSQNYTEQSPTSCILAN